MTIPRSEGRSENFRQHLYLHEEQPKRNPPQRSLLPHIQRRRVSQLVFLGRLYQAVSTRIDPDVNVHVFICSSETEIRVLQQLFDFTSGSEAFVVTPSYFLASILEGLKMTGYTVTTATREKAAVNPEFAEYLAKAEEICYHNLLRFKIPLTRQP